MALDIEQDLAHIRPTLVLGLVGFGPDQRVLIERHLARRAAARIRWRTGSVGESDAWWINGARARLLPDGSLRIAAGEPHDRSVRLALVEVDRPVAFSEADNLEFEPAYSFRVEDDRSVDLLLAMLESRWLASAAARMWLAGCLVAAEGKLVNRVYHLVSEGRLLAVIDRVGDIGFAPGVSVDELARAAWTPRPSLAAAIPSAFHRTTISELVWTYAARSESDLLPQRYRSGRIYFRRPPRIPQRLLGDDHLRVMRELALVPATFGELLERTGLGESALASALTALYLVGSVTTNAQRIPKQAGHPRAVSTEAVPPESTLWALSANAAAAEGAARVRRADFTVPASLLRTAAASTEAVP